MGSQYKAALAMIYKVSAAHVVVFLLGAASLLDHFYKIVIV
jgi:hypothetical protein